MDSIFYIIKTLTIEAFSFLVGTIVTLLLLIMVFYYENKPFQEVKKILQEHNFIIYKYDWSPKKMIVQKTVKVASFFKLINNPEKAYFGEIKAKTFKNQSFLMVEEKTENYPNNKIVFGLRNPKNHFPSFTMARKVWAPLPKSKKFSERSIYDYYSVVTNNNDLLVTKFSHFKLKKYIRSMATQVFQIEHDYQLQTTTLMADKLLISPPVVVKFLLDLDEELEDYTEPMIANRQEESDQKVVSKEVTLPHSVKIYNLVSLVNINDVRIKCVVCWGPIDYSTETLIFECCTGYTHLDHGLDWLQNNKDECPKCGQEHPFTIQLPSISLR